MTRNGFMKLVNGSGKFYKDYRYYNEAVSRMQEHPESYAEGYLDHYKETLYLTYENASGMLKNYITVRPMRTFEAGEILRVPGRYTVCSQSKRAYDDDISEQTQYFDISQEDLDTLLRKHELTFGY